MEEIYSAESYGASNHFPLKHYFQTFSNTVCLDRLPQIDEEIKETEYLLAVKDLLDLDVTYNDLQNVSENCSINQLDCLDEDTENYPMKLPDNINSNSKFSTPFMTTDSGLLMVNKCITELEMQGTQLNQGNKRIYHKKIDFSIPAVPPDLNPGCEFVISVLIYKPVAFKFFNAKNASEKLRFSHEIVCLGRTYLNELRDAIFCSSDFGLYKEVDSTSSDLKSLADAKKIYPSGFIFIDNIFYNDLRDSKAIDYSIPIMEWAKQKKIDLSSKDITGVTISDLTPRFGYPYLYMHQGDCEHLLVFRDAKLLDSTDCLHSQAYPHILKLNRNTNKMCFLCSVSFAKWICVGSDRFPQHKVFLCTGCCNAYNYLNGEKIGDFKLYPYYEKHVNL